MTSPLFPEWDAAARAEGERRRDEAMRRVDGNAEVDWKDCAREAIRYIAERRPEMTTDPVWYMLDSWHVPFPHEPRALGPLMKAAVTRGWLRPTARVHKSVRPECHRRPLAIYESLLYHGTLRSPL